MWTSRDSWIGDVSAWLATDEGLATCSRLHIRPERVFRAAVVLAAHADHGTGRNCAAANATVAAGAGCSERTVTNARVVLAASGLAVEVHRGTGSAIAPGYGRRPSIWHLISAPKPVVEAPCAEPVCDLPPSRRDRRESPVRELSPSTRKRARGPKSNPPQSSPRRSRRRGAPRPLHVQLLAADLVDQVRSLRHGHIGRICDALMASGLDLSAWTGKSLQLALDADGKTRGWDWPQRVERPGSFLLTRLRHLPARPAVSAPGGLAARLATRKALATRDADGQTRQDDQARTARWHADVSAVTTPEQRARLLSAHTAKFGRVVDLVAAIAGAGRRAVRLYPQLSLADGLTRWADDVLGVESESVAARQVPAVVSLSSELLMGLAIGNCDCMVCGSAAGTSREQLPLKSSVCDLCWPVIAAELDGVSDQEVYAS